MVARTRKVTAKATKAQSKKASAETKGSKAIKLPPSLPSGRTALGGSLRGPVVGVDEAGRGPWAGPVVAAAVSVAETKILAKLLGVTDSKKLNEEQRENVFKQLTGCPKISWSVAVVSRARIDRLNILEAAHEAMASAVRGLRSGTSGSSKSRGGKVVPRPGTVLVDGNLIPKKLSDESCKAVIGGDRTCFEIAAASVLAKVTRDRLMGKLHRRFPAYGFASHKGYGTAAHQAALSRHGPCAEHRRSFEPIKGFLETGRWKKRGSKPAD
mmetsp:Transcript_59672/g.106068  ORF Transcript_59672/g.106068 Transcript_59672/m.106068 type:complete len:269 (+) Transcript_59672:33-839(+)